MPIKVDTNIIEVLPAGTVFRIAGKRFQTLESFPTGFTPRAFVRYHYFSDRVPFPAPFISGKS